MKKKYLLILLISLMAILMTGCLKYDIEMTVKKDGTVDVDFVYAVNSRYKEYFASDVDFGISDKDLKTFESLGFTKSHYSKDLFSGEYVTKSNIPIDDVLFVTDAQGGSKEIKFTKDEEGVYHLNLDLSDIDLSQLESSEQYFRNFNGTISLMISLPNRPISSNATSVTDNGKTLTWDILQLKDDPKIELSFKVYKYNYLLIGCIAFFVIAATAAVIIIVKKSKKSTNKKK